MWCAYDVRICDSDKRKCLRTFSDSKQFNSLRRERIETRIVCDVCSSKLNEREPMSSDNLVLFTSRNKRFSMKHNSFILFELALASIHLFYCIKPRLSISIVIHRIIFVFLFISPTIYTVVMTFTCEWNKHIFLSFRRLPSAPLSAIHRSRVKVFVSFMRASWQNGNDLIVSRAIEIYADFPTLPPHTIAIVIANKLFWYNLCEEQCSCARQPVQS